MYEPLAIVGTACRFPSAASSPSKLWDLLKAPRDVAKKFPGERLRAENFYHENGEMHGRSNVNQQSYLLEEDIRHFDAAFFRINPKEAADMDPQQRILLETVYESFEAAGWSLQDVSGSQTSVHVGFMTDDHTYIQSRDPETLGSHASFGVSRAMLSNRISYAFNLQGASLSLDTACSSSLVALHLAAQGLHRGEATQAVVAGANLLMDPLWYLMQSSLHMLSPDSRCRMWDKDANGYARGEGCAAIVLKTLRQAIHDGDHVECVLRGTGVNSDGNTNGITMPSPTTQAALIRQTYQDAGLEPATNRCQYFECHGTGTQAGDPVEAQAIRESFFPGDEPDWREVMYCGSIKTVIGHLEGCAGLAGVIKAALAIQNKEIPPNMHFNQLNPKVEPFYRNLEVPTSLVPWPETHDNVRRASVNSFGYGGTNAHAILESYEPSNLSLASPSDSQVGQNRVRQSAVGGRLVGPFVFSARTPISLVNWLKELLNYLRVNGFLDVDSLSSSLHSKRSVFPCRVAIPTASDRDDLIRKVEDQINTMNTTTDTAPRVGSASADQEQPKILGIFTGQGAQAARMGYALLEYCELFKTSITECEMALKSIPEPPSWSLSEELAADASSSRVSEARFSQPLCTAIQIGLVDLLHACGIRFSAVIGHSSGEISAAYAAGLLTRNDAICISYYRGHVAHLAQGDGGKPGGMMAAGMSFDTAEALCFEPRFKSRIKVAASNSPSSVTLSGDKDAILEMKKHLDGSNIQARPLQVDTAYHSHHMLACADAYMEHLKQLNVHIQTPKNDQKCHWYSSVKRGTNVAEKPLECGLDAQYWLDNMTQPVLFSEALQLSMQDKTGKFTAAVEVGPHPALRGPVNQTLKQSIDYSPAYTGCLRRGTNGIETVSEVLTMIWSVAPLSIDFAGWRASFGLVERPQALKGLPPYAWDHTQVHWRESRLVHHYRLGSQPPHDILGRLWNDAQYEHTWRNILKLNEMSWVKGHVFQGQSIFPATGYISLAIDAAKAFVKGRPIKVVEVRDMTIPAALAIGEGDEVEVLFNIRSRVSPEKIQAGSVLETDFACYSYPDQRNAERTCCGRMLVHLGEYEPGDLAPISISEIELTPFNIDRFYRAVSEIGFEYDGAFRALTALNKCCGHAKGAATWSKEDLNLNCSIHPAILDIGLQAGLSAFVSTAEGSMHSPYLPVGIKSAIINPNEDFRGSGDSTEVEIEAFLTSHGMSKLVETDINLRNTATAPNGICGVQLEGVRFQAISEPSPSQDRNILAKTVWGLDPSYGLVNSVAKKVSPKPSSYTPEEYERVALFYLQSLAQSVNPRQLRSLTPHRQKLIRYADAMVANVRETDHPFLQKEWLLDSQATIKDLQTRDPADVGMKMLTGSGEQTLALLRGESKLNDDQLNDLWADFYQNSSGLAVCRHYVADLLSQISHKFPRTDILELSVGDSMTTVAALDTIDDAYTSYTCASASKAVIDRLKEKLPRAEAEKVAFKQLIVEAEAHVGDYDVVITTDVLRASRDFSETVQNLRNLLRPGGFLICVEPTGPSLRSTAMMGGLEHWWVAADVSETDGPGITTGQWDKLLNQNGFSGIDTIFHDQPGSSLYGFSVFCAQARDDRLDTLRDPLMSMDAIAPAPVVIIGGETSQVSKLVRRAEKTLQGWTREIQVYSRFDEVDCRRIPPKSSVLCLQDLDKPIFSSPPSAGELQNLKDVLESCQNVLWATSARLVGNPHANIIIGIGRSLRLELSNLNLHFLDFDEGDPWDIEVLMAQFIRLIFVSSAPNITEGMLWLDEPEIVIRDSQMLVARIVPDDASNKVYNANRRRIARPVDPEEPVDIVEDASSKPALVCSPLIDIPSGHLPIQVKLSVALHAEDDSPCFLCYGNRKYDDQKGTLALSRTPSSVVSVRQDLNPTCLEGCTPAVLVNLASFLIASHVVSKMPSRGTSLVCSSSKELAKVISVMAAKSGRKAVFITIAKHARSERPGWILIHPQTPARIAQRLLPSDSSTLITLSKNDVEFFLPRLPASCTARSLDASDISQQSLSEAIETWQKHGDDFTWASKPTVVNIRELSEKHDAEFGHLSVVTNWERQSPVDAIVRGLEPATMLSPNKTYLLVGMASELGQSLTYFMVRGGARHVVLSSRNPKDDKHWIRDLRSTGIDIRVVKMDVTERWQVRETVYMIRRTMPEIGGVANAALVLEPGAFANLSAASIAKQLKPKVYGTVHLDEEFKSDNLDFFLMFGSLLTVCGNAGQAIYHAGNAFMMSWVQNRRRRGLAASVLNFGVLVDAGFVARADRSTGSNVEDWLRSDIPTTLSEADFHHAILQGIVAGRPESRSGEVIMGLEIYHDQGQGPKPRWVDTAIFSHMVRVSEARKDDQTDNAPSSIQKLQTDLKQACTVDEVIAPITELFSRKIESMMYVSLHSIQPDEPLSHLGIDSLSAIEIRSWLRDKFQVQVPMHKILGRNSSSSLLEIVAREYMAKKPAEKPRPQEAHAAKQPQPTRTELNVKQAQKQSKAALEGQTKPPSVTSTTTSQHDRVNKASSTSSDSSPGVSHITTPDGSEEIEFTRSERMSSAQAGFFYLSAFADSPTPFNLCLRYRIDGPLNVEGFSQAFEMTIRRHDALQTCFFPTFEGSEVRQHVGRIKPSRVSLVQSTPETAEVDMQRAFYQMTQHQFSLPTGDTHRCILISHDTHHHTLILGFHNIAIDTLTVSYILEDTDRAYRLQPLSRSHPSYLDYTRQQIDDINKGRFDDSIEYWKHLLDPIPDPLPLLPIAKTKSRQMGRKYGHHVIERELSSEFMKLVTKVSRAHGVTLMQFYLAAMQVLFCRMLEVNDICIGVVYSGRNPTGEFAKTFGHMANILPIRFRGSLDKSFPEVLENTSQTLLESLDHGSLPFGVLLDNVRSKKGKGNVSLIQVALNYRTNESTTSPMGKCTMVAEDASYSTLYDLTIDVLESPSGGHILGMRCSDDYYTLPGTVFMAETFVNVIESLVQDPGAMVKDYGLFSDAQLEQARTVAQGPSAQHSWPDSLSEALEQAVARFPDSVAIRDGGKTMTYSELMHRVAFHANILLDANISAGSRVACFCEPSIDLYATMLAVFHIGAVFVPLDVSVPAARRKDMMKACNPDVLVFHEATAPTAIENHSNDGIRLLNLTKLSQSSRKEASIPERAMSDSGSDSYILFTSGSTGAPKGIKLHQRVMMNWAAFSNDVFGFEQVKVLQQTSIGFDLSFGQIYNAFTTAGTLAVVPVQARGDPDGLSRLMLDEEIQYTLCTPSEYSLLLTYAQETLQQCKSWRFAGTAGEALPERLINAMQALRLPQLTLVDCYGPAEAFIVTTRVIPVHVGAARDRSKDKTGSIGHALPNTAIYITSESDGSLLPLGMPGEVCIGGTCVANGYLDPKISESKFVKDPFTAIQHGRKVVNIMYKSGDRGSLHADGSVVFLGRAEGANTVVKLRGFRIDLNEVTGAVLQAAPDHIADAAVTIRGDPQFLVCHVVFKPCQTLQQPELINLRQTLALPQYMIPSSIIPLDSLPVTPNGKLDIARLESLPLPTTPGIASNVPGVELTKTEARLRAIWIDVIGVVASTVDIGPSSCFFAVGGNSLLLVYLQHAIKGQIGVKIALPQLREVSDLRSMAAMSEREKRS